jgi:hypothetical protein
MFKFIAKLRHFQKSIISRKTPVLIMLNRQLPDGMGSVIDFSMDHERNSLIIELEHADNLNIIEVKNYAVHLLDNETIVSWKKIHATGESAKILNEMFPAKKSMALPAYLFNLVSGVMGGSKASKS